MIFQTQAEQDSRGPDAMPIMKVVITTALILMSFGVLSQTNGQAIHDLKDRQFSAKEVIDALRAQPPTETDNSGANSGNATRPGRRIRGLAVVPTQGVAEVAIPDSNSAAPRRVSMQLQFGLDSAEIMESAKSRLDALGVALQSQELAATSFIISGHTDSTGGYAHNVALSKRRAEAVRNYLLGRHTISPNRLVAVGKGPDEFLDPLNPRSPSNRRVQVETLQ